MGWLGYLPVHHLGQNLVQYIKIPCQRGGGEEEDVDLSLSSSTPTTPSIDMSKLKKKKKVQKVLLSSILLLLFLFNITVSSTDHGGSKDSSRRVLLGEEEHCPDIRRALWASPNPTNRRYISYEALKGDNVPCSRPGVPYYNCHVLPKANPYARGCSVITACRG